MNRIKSKTLTKKVNLSLGNLDSVFGKDWEDNIYEIKSKIYKGDRFNLLECLLQSAVQLKQLLLEGQKLVTTDDESKPDQHSSDDFEPEADSARECNLMVFGEWDSKENFSENIHGVLNALGVNEEPLHTAILKTPSEVDKN